MSQSGIDLSQLPEPVRGKLQARLDRLPAELRNKLAASLERLPVEARAEILSKGSATLDKLLDRMEKSLPGAGRGGSSTTAASPAAAARQKTPSGLYSKTVQRGDHLSLPFGVIVLVAGGLLLLVYRLGLLSF